MKHFGAIHIARPEISFRADVEWLRGFAVLLVMLYHFEVPGFTGGYIGVDVFFVISGYLVSSIIFRDLEQGRLKFTVFFNRRIKRLLPALIVFCIVAGICSYFLLLPDAFIDFLKSFRELLLFRSNAFFADELSNYFAANAESMPLLHTWSLALEWQFYFLIPFFLVLVHKLANAFFEDAGVYAPFCIVLAVFVVAALWSILVTGQSEADYFKFSTRVFEFIGGVLAAFITLRTASLWSRYAVKLGPVLGLLVMALIYDAETVFPGSSAFFVVAITMLFLSAGDGTGLPAKAIALGLGRLSYSAYLYHWLFVFLAAELAWIEFGGYLWVLLLGATIIVAHISYRYVEEPARKGRGGLLHSAVFYWFIPLFIGLILVYWAKAADGSPARLGKNYAAAYESVISAVDQDRERCHAYSEVSLSSCTFGDSASEKTALLIGDSHGSHYWSFIKKLAEDNQLRVYGRTGSSCLAIPGVEVVNGGGSRPLCKLYMEALRGWLAEAQPEYVFIGQRWAGYFDSVIKTEDHAATMGVEQAMHHWLAEIVAAGATPVFLAPVPERSKDLKACFYQALRQGNTEACNFELDDSTGQHQEFYRMLSRLRLTYPSIGMVDLTKVLCAEERCEIGDGVAPYYVDENHLNDRAAERLYLPWKSAGGEFFQSH